MPKRNWKKHQKNTSPESLLTSILTSKNLPKSLQNRPGTRKNGGLDEACFATLCKLPANRRKLTEVVVCKASKWPRIWLGLLHPSIYPSIHWSAPRRPNHQSKFFNLKRFTQISPEKNSKNPTETFPTTSPNHTKTLAKPSQNRFKNDQTS